MKDLPQALPKREFRYAILRRELEQVIQSTPPGGPLPSYTEMMRTYGVGQSTIDRVIREFDDNGLIVRKAGKGIFVSERTAQKTVGFVLGRDITQIGSSPICTMLMQQSQVRASESHLNFKFYFDLPGVQNESGVLLHQQLADDIVGRRLDGILLVWSYGPEETRWFRSLNVPLVSLGSEADIDTHSVIIDYMELIKLGTTALQDAGCRKIGLLSPSGYLRKTGIKKDLTIFQQTLEKKGCVYHPEFVLEDYTTRSINAGGTMTNEELGFEIMKQFIATHKTGNPEAPLPIDGLVSEDDMFTRGALAALYQSSIHPPRDLKIATHANKGAPVLKTHAKDLIRLEIDPEEVVSAMFSLLESMMDGKPLADPKRYVSPHLIVNG